METGGPQGPSWPFDPFTQGELEEAEEETWPDDPFAREKEAKQAPDGPWQGDPFAREKESGGRGAQWMRGSGRRSRRGEGPRSAERSDLGFLARGSILNMVGVVVNTIFSFVLVVVVTHQLGKGRDGIFFEAIALFTILSNTAELGADGGLLRMIPRYRALHRTQDIRRAIWIGVYPALASGIIGGALLWLYTPQLVHVFFKSNDPRILVGAVPFVRILALFLPLSCVSTVLLAATRGFGAMLPAVTIENTAKPIVRPVLVYGAIAGGLGLTAVAWAWALPIAAGFAVSVWWLRHLVRRAERRDQREHGPPRPVRQLAPEFWRFAAPRGLAGALNTSQVWFSTLFVGGLASTGASAIFTASSRLILIGSFAIQAMQLVVAPQMAGLLAIEDRSRANTVFQTATQWLMAPSWPIYFALAVFAPLFLRIYPARYEAGQGVLLVLSLVLLLAMATGPVNITLVMGGKSGWTLLNSAAGLALNLVLNIVLIPRYGIIGAAYAWAAAIFFTQVTQLMMVRIFLKLNPFGPGALMIAVVSAAIFGGLGLLTRFTLGISIPAFLLYAVVSTALYALFIWRFRKQLHLNEISRALKGRGIRRMGRDWHPA